MKKVDEEKKRNWNELIGVSLRLGRLLKRVYVVGKVPCILVEYKGKRYILKEVKKSMNFGKDCLVVDRCKSVFGLRDMNMKRIRSNRLCW